MSQAIRDVFLRARKEAGTVFIGYVIAGYPRIEEYIDVLLGLQAGGVDLIEVGVPFSDPIADGPTIQNSSSVVLSQGMDSLDKVLNLVKEARKKGVLVPIILMGYYNMFLSVGESLAVKKAAECDVNGFIIVDLPLEESESFRSACRAHQLSFIPLVTPTTTNERIIKATSIADSFMYVVSVTGVTGTRANVDQDLPELIKRLRTYVRDTPLAVGFGVSNSEQYREVAKLADGVVIGSAFINALSDTKPGTAGDTAKKFAESICPRMKVEKVSISYQVRETEGNNVHGPPLTYDVDRGKEEGRFGDFGGRYVPETLSVALNELETIYNELRKDPKFWKEFESFYDFLGRPSRLHCAERLTKRFGGAKIWLKREDLNHTGSHKINNALGQVLIARKLGKSRIICETGAGQHGVATATICARFGLQCVVYMGSEDVRRQSLNVFRMKLLGAQVVPVESGSKTLKDAVNESMRDWVTNVRESHLVIGSIIGPHPFPTIVRDLQSIIGKETKIQLFEKEGKLPDAVIACVGGGSNSIGMFHPFIDDKTVRLIGVEAAGSGLNTPYHAATLAAGRPGVLHGTKTYILQTDSGQIQETHSISAGLDYPGVGPEHAYLKTTGRAEYFVATDKEALEALMLLTRTEGIIPALETAHAIHIAMKVASEMKPHQNVVICISGRGDKDMHTVMDSLPLFNISV